MKRILVALLLFALLAGVAHDLVANPAGAPSTVFGVVVVSYLVWRALPSIRRDLARVRLRGHGRHGERVGGML